ncbi:MULTISPECIES: NADPH-dependent FMN reductase [Flavobacterium]|uniref:NADPH-dependent FMN reductase n=1 Tax=Flavobacterium jumunjinense TaxID=998845 RepID=A0ABV5GI18_9FLAO|nr:MULTISPECIES: NAD(P)H-dependent oxidoreductase [Flavobacterium]
MKIKKNIIGICGSASQNSKNLFILRYLSEYGNSDFNFEILDDLTVLPHFKTEYTDENVPLEVVAFRNKIANADGIIICTPEYVFSIPSGLKNMIEWFVSTTVFSDKPIGLITASSSGNKGHEELKLIMKTVQTKFIGETTLLINGIKGKVNENGEISDVNTEKELKIFYQSFKELIEK